MFPGNSGGAYRGHPSNGGSDVRVVNDSDRPLISCQKIGGLTDSVTILKRLLLWFVESSCEAILTGTLLVAFAHVQFGGHNRRDDQLFQDLLLASVLVSVMFFSTGYLLTTIIARLFLNPERKYLYPCIAFALYVVHFEILNIETGGMFGPSERWLVRVVGPCIAFACTLGGNLVLSKWKSSSPLIGTA